MFWRSFLSAGAFLALIGGASAAGAAVVGTASIDVALDLVVTDITIEIDPDDSGPLSAVTFGPGASAALGFDYDLDLPEGPADYFVDIRLNASSVSAIFENPFPTGPANFVVPLLGSLPVATPLELFAATLILPGLTSAELAALSPLDRVLSILAADSGSFILLLPASGPVSVGLVTGSYDFDPGATPTAGSGVAELRYAADGLFAALQQPLLEELPDPVTQAIADFGLPLSGLFNSLRGVEGAFTLDIGVIAVAPVPLPAGALLLPAALGGLMLVRRRRRRVG